MFQEYIETILKSGSAYINRSLVRSKTDYHSHNFVEIAYVAEGQGTHIVNGIEHKTSKGDIVLINYDIPHEFISEGEPLLIYNCIFTPAYFNDALGESRNFFDITDRFLLTNLYTNLPTDYIFASASGTESIHILNIYERMLREFTAKQIGYRDIMRGYVIELLVIICRLKLNVDSGKTQKMLEILDHINVHYKENIKVEELAAVVGYSPSHFRRVFKALTGKTTSLYIQTLRVQEACKLLGKREMSVEQIAEAVGYSDMKHFYTVFKRITHKLPKAFR
jgi:AraC-like DNA-binding protein/mannose-6-phosphate isomerase-like protein (cupin superfamily)